MKSIIKSLLLIIPLLIIFTGCGKQPVMNELSKEGKYPYKNEDLGFGLNLPEEFIYYQTQRNNNDAYTGLDIFLPTNDTARQIDVPGYWKALMIRVYDKSAYEGLGEKSDEKKMFEKIGENGDRVYLLRFWEDTPEDWKDRWSDDLESAVKAGFYTIK